jgi:hypothetical protein
MFVSRILKLAALPIVALALAGCGTPPGDPPRNWPAATKVGIPAGESIKSTDNLVVYLDTSASMAGYVSPNGKAEFGSSPEGTVFSRTLLELRKVVTTMNPQPQIVVRTVDTNVSSPLFSDLELSKASVSRSIFVGRETNLAGAIKSFAEPLEKDSEDQSPPRFHILVTDGVQSSDKNNVDVSCAKGSDAFCVKKQLLELINKGWGGAVLGMRSEFNGTVYSEVNNKPVPFNSGKDPNKFRPFYLYVFSPDRTGLNKLVESLREKLLPLGREESFREYALTAEYSTDGETIALKQDPQTKDLLEVKQEKGKEGDPPHIQVKSALDTETKGKQQFVVSIKPAWTPHAIAGGSADELARMIKWEVKSVFPEKEVDGTRYPAFGLVKQEAKEGGVELTFETGWVRAPGPRDWRMYHVIGRLNVDRTAIPWVSAWTTNLDSTPDNANKTLNLESSLANLWNNTALENYTVVEFAVRIGQK